jgi:hypothetical protein
MHVSSLNAYTDFLYLSYCLREHHHIQHTMGVLLHSLVDK